MKYYKGEILFGYSLNDAKNLKQIIPVGLPFTNNENEKNIKIGYINDASSAPEEKDLGSQKIDDGKLPKTSSYYIKVNNLNGNFIPIQMNFFLKNYDKIDDVNEIYDSNSFNFLNIFNNGAIESNITFNNDGSSSIKILQFGNFMAQLTSAGNSIKSQFINIASKASQTSKKRNKNDIIIMGKIVMLYTMDQPKTETFSFNRNNYIGI